MADPINWLLTVELVAIVIGASSFLYYWNRLVAAVFAFLIRLYTWRAYSAYISIGSLQVSPLAGRISWRDLQYHSSNLSVRALNGHVTWRYWKLRVRQEGDAESSNTKRNRLPCRITVYASGVEGFVFNRTPAYDAIVERMKKHEQQEDDEQKSSADSTATSSDGLHLGARLRKVANRPNTETSSDQRRSDDTDYHPSKPVAPGSDLPYQPKPIETPVPDGVNWFREALPIDIRILNGSVILGSDATPMVLIGDFKGAEGVLSVSDSRSVCDQYKVSMEIKFEHPSVLMRTNVDYSGPILSHGKKAYDELLKQQQDISRQLPSTISAFFGFHTLARSFPFLYDPKFSSPPIAGLPRDRVWKGLARYRMADKDESMAPPRGEDREYGKVTTLLETPALDFTYYADTPGPVPLPRSAELIDETDEVGNVEPPPEYGIDLVIHGGFVKYGPWADRQRDALQRAFAPSIFFDSEPRARLRPGETRIHTALAVNIQLSEETTLRMPTREPSKDWMYDHSGADVQRRYGWLDVTAGANSSIFFTQAQLATQHGYDAMLVLNLDSLQIGSSVNLETFVTSTACKVSMTMPTPLSWDAQRDWGLDVTFESPDITLLRDHVQLISDLSRDWSSGALGDFHHFVPNHYNFRVAFLNYAFHLYVNDYNIVDRPKSRDDNAFMDVTGPRLDAYVAVSTTQYRPELAVIPFSVHLPNARIELCLPKWDTHRSFGDGSAVEVGRIGDVTATGSYRYYSVPRSDHQETLTLHLEGRRVVFKAVGWAVRRMFCVKDNYFGSFTQFTTMQEYLERFDHDPNSVGDPVEEKYRPGRSDPFTVIVTMNVEESLVLLSDEIYSCRRGLVMPVPQLQMALRSIEQFMEMSLDVLPTYTVASTDLAKAYESGSAPSIDAKEVIFLEGVTLKANRLFGPPPRVTSYLCLWEASIARVSAFLSPALTMTFKAAIDAVLYNFDDIDNAPASIYIPKEPPDVTFFKLGIENVSATLFSDDSAVNIDLPCGLNLNTSSLATRFCSSSVGVALPNIVVTLLHRDAQSREWVPVGNLRSDLCVDVYKAPKGWHGKASRQQEFIRKQDALTKRIWYMYGEGNDSSGELRRTSENESSEGKHEDGIYLPCPRSVSPGVEVDERSSINDTRIEEEMRPSSPESTGTDRRRDLTRHARLSRRSRSFANAKQDREDLSDGNQSDSAFSSSSTSASSISAHSFLGGSDMSRVLADRMRHFRADDDLRETADPDDGRQERAFPLKSKQGRCDGVIVRLSSEKLSIKGNLDCINCVTGVAKAWIDTVQQPEVELDALLIRHADVALEDERQSASSTLDIHFRNIGLHLTTLAGAGDLCSTLDLRTRGIKCALQSTPNNGIDTSSLDIAVYLDTVSVVLASETLSKGELCLQDVGNASGGVGKDVLSLTLDKIQVGLLQAPQWTQVQGSVELVDIEFVTSVFISTLGLVKTWENAIDLSQSALRRSPLSSAGALLSRIVRQAIATNRTSDQPPFVYESAYGLHVEDERNIRRNLGWMMLARLRHWHRAVMPNIEAVEMSAKETGEFVVAQLAAYDETVGVNDTLVRQQGFLRQAFGHHIDRTQHQEAKDPSSKLAVFVTMGSMTFRHHAPLLETGDIAPSITRMLSASIGMQQTSTLRDGRRIAQIRIVTTMRSIDIDIQSGAFSAAQSLLDNMQQVKTEGATPPKSPKAPDLASMLIIDYHIDTAALSLLASGLRLRLAAHGPHVTMSRSRTNKVKSERGLEDENTNLTICMDSIELALLQPTDEHDLITHSVDRVVMSTRADGLRLAAEKYDSNGGARSSSVCMLVGVRNMHFDSRPQLRAFYYFAQDWRARHYRHYKPFVDRFGGTPAKRMAKKPSASLPTITKVDLSIGSIHLQIRAAKSVWLRWDLGKTFISHQAFQKDVRFGVRMAGQLVGAYTSTRRSKSRDSSTIRLPSLSAIGTFRQTDGRPHLTTTINLGFFVGVLKPVVLDRLLSLHQRLGADIKAFILEYRENASPTPETRQRHAVSPLFSSPSDSAKPGKVLFDLRTSIAGVRFGLKADDVAATLLFEAFALRGYATNQTTSDHKAISWRAKVEHFGLSLGHVASTDLADEVEPSRRHRSAYAVVDVDIQEIPCPNGAMSQLNLYLNRMHTVMHVAALSELSDLVRSWQSDIHILRDARASQVAEVKVQTTNILKQLETPADKITQPDVSWFANRLFTVEATGLGIAIPLDEAAAINLEQGDSSVTPALLFSIRVISFHNRRNETARFRLQQIALQFIDRFDQGITDHFNGDHNPGINRMSLPEIDTKAQMASTPGSWSLSAHCSATDFKLSLAPDVAESIYKLIDLYDHGKVRVHELEEQYRLEMVKRDPQESVAAKYEGSNSPTTSRPAQRIMVRMSFTFNSGIVELTPTLTADERRSARGRPTRSGVQDVFTLPTISVWTDHAGRRTDIVGSADGSLDYAVLVINAAVHESRNTLRPTILPFFADAINRIEGRMKMSRSPTAVISRRPSSALPNSVSETTLQAIANAPTERCQVQFTLRIDRSELRLSCAPDSNAYIDVKWESGGFLARTMIGGKAISTFAGSVSGVTASLSHEFAEQGRSCIEAGAKDMAFTVTVCPGAEDSQSGGISVVLDTQISAKFRLDAFSAWLIFTSVWIKNAPKLEIPLRPAIPEAAAPESAPLAVMHPKMTVAALVRFRSVDFDANIAVSQARLEMTPITLQTLSNGERTDVDLRIGVTQVSAQGDISGDVRSQSLVFNTTRRSSRASDSADATVLQLSIHGGDLSGNLFLAETNIVRFHLDPSHVILADDWKAVTHNPAAQVFLAFAVKAGDFEGVLRLLAIPRLLGNLYSIFDMVDSQRKIAVQRSESFKLTEARESSGNSPVAAVILKNTLISNATTSSSQVKTAQTMRFDLSGIDIGVFNEDLEDGHVADFYRFVVGKIEADLKRQLSREDLPTRELNLLVSYVRWDTMDGSRATAQEKRCMSARQLIDLAGRSGRREVASLPLMTLKMPSMEYPDPATLDYDFDLLWGETDGDVAILPNFFEQAYDAFQKLLKGLDEQQLARARRMGIIADLPKPKGRHAKEEEVPALHSTLAYRQRQTEHSRSMPIPRLKLLGEGTTDAAKLVPKIKQAVNELPSMSHRFVTLPLEEGMDLLLKLYEKQLPSRTM